MSVFARTTLIGCITLLPSVLATPLLAQPTALQAGQAYVALGSSFAAGPGIAEQQPTCGRSNHNYPHLVAAALGLVLTDVSCSGATTDHVLDARQGEAPPQLTAVTADAALVTLTIGGNDIRYSASTGRCAGAKPEDRCTAKLDQIAIERATSKLPARLGEVVDAIRSKAPNAVIVMVPYPRVIPVEAQRCTALGLADDDAEYLAELGHRLEEAMVTAAQEHGALVADTYVLSDGHGPCAPLEARWVNGAEPESSGASFHPTGLGHEAMAQEVLRVLGAAR